MNTLLFGIILLLIGFIFSMILTKSNFVNYVAHYAPKSQKGWYNRPGWERFGFPYYSFWENFENSNNNSDKTHKNTNETFVSDSAGPADIYNKNPYHLLSDEFAPPRINETISCVNSRSCYATDFQRMVDKTGNYRQLTNNYKRNYPDSCSAPYQELVLNFYKTEPVPIPKMNTGGSVSEVGFGLN